METVLISIFGTFGLGVIGAVFGFSRERLNKADIELERCHKDTLWYRDQLLPVLEHQQAILERQQAMLEALERDRGHDNN